MTVDRHATSFNPVYGSGGTISYDGATNSGNLPAGIAGVFVTCSTDAWARLRPVAAGVAPAATTKDMFCPAGSSVFIPDMGYTNEPMQLSVIKDATAGSARYTPMN